MMDKPWLNINFLMSAFSNDSFIQKNFAISLSLTENSVTNFLNNMYFQETFIFTCM